MLEHGGASKSSWKLHGPHFAQPQLSDCPKARQTDTQTADTLGTPHLPPAPRPLYRGERRVVS